MVIDATPVVRPEFRREYGWLGFNPRGQYMDVWTVTLAYSCDDTGGESPPATYSHPAGPTCLLVTARPEIPDGKRYGVYRAVYEANGSWTPT